MDMRVRPFQFAWWLAVGLAGIACEKATPSPSAEPSGSASAAASVSAAPSASAPAASDAGEDSAESAKKAEEEDESVKEEIQSQHRHHHRGIAGFVLMSIETLGIGPDQQAAVDKIRKEFHAKIRPIREANGAVLQLLGDGIAAGTIDKAKGDAALAKVGPAASVIPKATADVLDQLHAALHPEQRIALVDKIEANWAVWKETNGGEQAEEDAKPHGHLAHLAKEIGLTSEQVDKVRANLDAAKDSKKPFDAAAADAYVKAFDAAFVEDTFDAKKLPPSVADNTHIVSWGAERMVRFYEALAPVLTPDQRPKVADKLHERAAESNPKEKP
jgi:Spy/CpxP family protein refolding chaperone